MEGLSQQQPAQPSVTPRTAFSAAQASNRPLEGEGSQMPGSPHQPSSYTKYAMPAAVAALRLSLLLLSLLLLVPK